ncbi:MAG: hypothetical protein ACRYFX_27400 [Janthinobacterium lividum]
MTLHSLARPYHPTTLAAGTIWKMLFDRQVALLHRWATPDFRRGLAELGLRRDSLPNLNALSQAIRQRTGLTLLITNAPVAEPAYYAALARRELPVVSRLRTFAEFDQPPGGPDLFADVFGRLPLLLDAGYADALQTLGQAWESAATLAAVALLRRFDRATFELGLLVAADGQRRFYGATLLSSSRHLHQAAAADATRFRPLTGAARQLHQPVLPGAEPTPYYVAQSWAEVAAEIQQLRSALHCCA